MMYLSLFTFHFLLSTFCLYHTPSPCGFVQRRNGDCDPQRAQNDIQSFL